MEENEIIRAPQYQHARERYYKDHPVSLATKQYQEHSHGIYVHTEGTRNENGVSGNISSR